MRLMASLTQHDGMHTGRIDEQMAGLSCITLGHQYALSRGAHVALMDIKRVRFGNLSSNNGLRNSSLVLGSNSPTKSAATSYISLLPPAHIPGLSSSFFHSFHVFRSSPVQSTHLAVSVLVFSPSRSARSSAARRPCTVCRPAASAGGGAS